MAGREAVASAVAVTGQTPAEAHDISSLGEDITTGTDSYIDALPEGAGADGLKIDDMLSAEMDPVSPDPGTGVDPDEAKRERATELGDVPETKDHKERNDWLNDAREVVGDRVERVQKLLKEKEELQIKQRLEQLNKLLEKAQEEERTGAAREIEKKIRQTERTRDSLEDSYEKKLKTQQKRAEGLLNRTERDETDRQRLDNAGQDSSRETRAAERGFRNIDRMAEDLLKQEKKLTDEVLKMKALDEDAGKPE